MVSFRFHLVSLVAVFLALALGIGMGVTVIDKATVDLLQNRLDTVRNDVNAANQRSGQLQNQLDQDAKFADQANAYLIQNRLENVNVNIVRVQGIDGASIDQLTQSIQDAGGLVRGTLTLTDRLTLTDSNDLSDLGVALGIASTDAGTLRQAFIARLNAVLSGSSGGNVLTPFVQAGFINWAPSSNGVDLASTNFASSRLVIASGANASVPNTDLMLPLTRSLASAPTRRVLAVEAGVSASGNNPEVRATYVGPLRDDRSVRDAISTVDDLERPAGRVAAVLALSQLGEAKVGQYGVASSASSEIPPLTS